MVYPTYIPNIWFLKWVGCSHRHVFLRVRDETFTLRIYIYQLTQCNASISKQYYSKYCYFLIHMNYFNVRIIFIIIRNCLFCNCLNHILNEDAILHLSILFESLRTMVFRTCTHTFFPFNIQNYFSHLSFLHHIQEWPIQVKKKFYAKTVVDGYKKQ